MYLGTYTCTLNPKAQTLYVYWYISPYRNNVVSKDSKEVKCYI
jgi:hypothetical protein